MSDIIIPISRIERYLAQIAENTAGGGGGGSSITVEALTATENKTYTAPEGKAYSPVTVNVPAGGGGLEYEEGTWTPNADTNHGSILFTKQHTSAPMFYAVLDTSDRSTLSSDTVIGCFYCDNYKTYNDMVDGKDKELNEEEFNLIYEWLR